MLILLRSLMWDDHQHLLANSLIKLFKRVHTVTFTLVRFNLVKKIAWYSLVSG